MPRRLTVDDILSDEGWQSGISLFERQGLRQVPGSVVRRGRNQCDVCARLLSLFRIDTLPRVEIELGSRDELLHASGCQLHAELIQRASSNHAGLENGMFCALKRDNRTVMIRYERGTSHELRLLSSTSTSVNVSGRRVNPSWIDHRRLMRWKRDCERSHDTCLPALEGMAAGPTWLIDCWLHCLVAANGAMPYIALSYVWGASKPLKTSKENLSRLEQPGALKEAAISQAIPKTVTDAMAFTSVLEERYLWVDSLCIVQDDHISKHTDIMNMASIFANAHLTIVAMDGDADHGIRGLPGISTPRHFIQRTVKLGKGTQILLASKREMQCNWNTRGWTFQEQLFSRRRIYFSKQAMRWQCCCSSISEEHDEACGDNHVLEATQYPVKDSFLPDLVLFRHYLLDYNTRSLTNPEDAHNAIAGTLMHTARSLKGGFISGIPAAFFDIGLLWLSESPLRRRIPKKQGLPALPSWSWLAWQGSLDLSTWHNGMFYQAVHPGLRMLDSHLFNIIPLVQWYYHCDKTLENIKIQNEWRLHRQRYENNPDSEVPIGWTRKMNLITANNEAEVGIGAWQVQAEYDLPVCYYEHVAQPWEKCWYPVPHPEKQEEPVVVLAPFISGRTKRAWLQGAEWITENRLIMSIRDTTGSWMGALQLQEELESEDNGEHTQQRLENISLELVEMAKGSYYPEDPYETKIDEWGYEERMKRYGQCDRYKFYWVLWIEWEDGIAYRKGLGRVAENAWESQTREWIDLTLG